VSLRLQMLTAARRAPDLLGESAELVCGYLRSQLNADGGFCDRAGASDVYYTVFGLEALLALGADIPFDRVAGFLTKFDDGADLDLVHVACLVRCWANLPTELCAATHRAALLRRVHAFRSADGAYNGTPSSEHGTAYDCLLAVEAHRDLNAELPDAAAIIACFRRLRQADGGYAAAFELPLALTPTTAAAAVLLPSLGEPVPADTAAWLLARHDAQGGFLVVPAAPMPDLLSTATALHALASLGVDLTPLRDPCLDFIDTLWSNRGAFCGSWSDETPDPEYTYYALLALGHLSS